MTHWRLRWTTSCCRPPVSKRFSRWITRSTRQSRPSTVSRRAGSSSSALLRWLFSLLLQLLYALYYHFCHIQDPQLFINKWLMSQTRDLKTMTDVAGNPEEERRCDFYYQPWATEAVCRYVLLLHRWEMTRISINLWCFYRYFYGKIQQRRSELDSSLGVRNS